MKGPLRHATRKCVRRGIGLGFGFAAARPSPRSAGRYSRVCAGRLRYHRLHGFTNTIAVPAGTRRYRSLLCAPVRCDLLWMSGRCGPESGPVEPGVARIVWRIEP